MAAKTVLVLGATGSFGGAVATELLRRGRPVRALVRDTAKLRARFGRRSELEIVEGDVLDPMALEGAAEGCGVIVHGVNYPYDLWTPHMYVATENVIATAEAKRALVLFPGNVYGLGDQTVAPLDEDAENAPCSDKGALRAELEDSLRRAASDGGARVLILRAGDYFGPTARNGMVDPIFGNAAVGRSIRTFGRLDIPHQWAYLPDLARVAADLMSKASRLAPFEVVNFAGHVVEREGEFLRLVAEQAGFPHLPVRVMPWGLLRVVGFFNGVVRELIEMRYLFDGAVILDDPRLRELLPGFKSTGLNKAVRDTVESYRRRAARPRPRVSGR